MKELILKSISDKEKNFKEIRKEFKFSGPNSGKELNNLLRQLINEDKIYYKNSTEKYYKKNEETFVGVFKSTKNAYGFVESDEKTVFIPGKFLLNAFEGDVVKVVVFPIDENTKDPEKRAGKIVRILKRNGDNLIFKYKKNEDDKLTLISDDIFIKQNYDFSNLSSWKTNILEGDIFLVTLKSVEKQNIIFEIKDKLGNEKDSKIDVDLIKIKYKIPETDNEKTKNEIDNINHKSDSSRVDLTNELIVTIDGDDSKDLDDAISLTLLENGYKLGVHIADVSHYVEENSYLDEMARTKGTSIYLINKVFPMLPEEISNNLCSLNPGEKKKTLSCEMIFDHQGNIIDYKIFNSEIVSLFRLTYNEVDEFLKNRNALLRDNKELSDMILKSYELSKKLREIKSDNGMIDFALKEMKIKLDDEDNPIEIFEKSQTKSEGMIEDLMVVTNETVASHFVDKDFPGIFRVHPKPKIENLENLFTILDIFKVKYNRDLETFSQKDYNFILEQIKDKEYEMIIKRYLIQSMEKAIYLSSNDGHYALGLKKYLHFTSPIRRYPDLITHRLLKKFLLNGKLNSLSKNDIILLKDEIDEIAKTSSTMERESMTIERKIFDIKKARFLENKVGQKMRGKITSFTKFGIFVELENLIHGMIVIEEIEGDEFIFEEESYRVIGKNDKQKKFNLGEDINVVLDGVDIGKGNINLKVLWK